MSEVSPENIADDQNNDSMGVTIKVEPDTEIGEAEYDDFSNITSDSQHRWTHAHNSFADLVEELSAKCGQDVIGSIDCNIKTEVTPGKFQQDMPPPIEEVVDSIQSNAPTEVKYEDGICSPNPTVKTETGFDEYRPSIYLTPNYIKFTSAGEGGVFQSNALFSKSLQPTRLVNTDLARAINGDVILSMDQNIGSVSLDSLSRKDLFQSADVPDNGYQKGTVKTEVNLNDVANVRNCSQELPKKERKKYKPRVKVKTEKKVYTVKGTFICNICGKVYGYKSGLKRHVQSEHESEINGRVKAVIACSFCDKVFKRKETLKRHEGRHLGTPKYVCEKCGKPYFRTDKYKDHLDVHKAQETQRFLAKIHHPAENIPQTVPVVLEPPEDCSVTCHLCNKVLKHKRSLYRHYHLYHAKELYPDKPVKQYTCKVCNKTYSGYTAGYRHHLQKHKPPRPCHVCNRTFSRLDHLQAHLVTHQRKEQKTIAHQPIVKRPRGRPKETTIKERFRDEKEETKIIEREKGRPVGIAIVKRSRGRTKGLKGSTRTATLINNTETERLSSVRTGGEDRRGTQEDSVGKRRKRTKIKFNEKEQSHERLSESE